VQNPDSEWTHIPSGLFAVQVETGDGPRPVEAGCGRQGELLTVVGQKFAIITFKPWIAVVVSL
jgi:hypothetical protein